MNDKKWVEGYNKKLARMRAAGNSKGVRKLVFGRYVRTMRLIIPELSQSKAARLAHMSRSQWARIEVGKHIPRPYKIAAMADAIRVQVSSLYRKAGYEVPKQYSLYDLKSASRDFTIALKESFSFQEFIARMLEVWQLFHQDQTKKRKGFFIDQRHAKLMADIYELMLPPQRIKLARELVRSVDPGTIRATLRDAPAFLKDMGHKVGMLDGDKRI
jgi:transcriptional regulator with XRE-family HTH domain